MNRKQTLREQAIKAAKELIDSLNLSTDERNLVLGIALDRFESVRQSLNSMGVSPNCLSAIFAAALEYSETLSHEGEGNLPSE